MDQPTGIGAGLTALGLLLAAAAGLAGAWIGREAGTALERLIRLTSRSFSWGLGAAVLGLLWSGGSFLVGASAGVAGWLLPEAAEGILRLGEESRRRREIQAMAEAAAERLSVSPGIIPALVWAGGYCRDAKIREALDVAVARARAGESLERALADAARQAGSRDFALFCEVAAAGSRLGADAAIQGMRRLGRLLERAAQLRADRLAETAGYGVFLILLSLLIPVFLLGAGGFWDFGRNMLTGTSAGRVVSSAALLCEAVVLGFVVRRTREAVRI